MAREDRIDPIVITLEDTKETFTLEFDRDAIRFAESRGFKIEDISDYPMTKVPEIFYYAFRMHHRNVSKEKTDRILNDYFGGIGGLPDGFMERLGALYGQPFTVLEDKEGKKGKVTVQL